MANAETSTKERTKTKLELSKPSLFNVVYVNDDVTTMEFVIMSLVGIFNHTLDTANTLCNKVHEEGSAIAATLPYEIAEQKGIEVTVLARNNGFPLMIRLEAAQ